jgi:hypothetical protein
VKKYFNFIWQERFAYIFAYVPKVACTNWKCVLRHQIGASDYLNPRLAHDREQSGLTFLSEEPRAHELLADPLLAKYAIVREPFSRALSAYLDKIEPFARDSTQPEQAIHFYRMFESIENFSRDHLPEDEGATFYAFLRWIRDSGDQIAANEHWLPQTELLQWGSVEFDFVGRFENLREDSSLLLKLIASKVQFPTREAVLFPPTEATRKRSSYYTERELEVVRDVFAADFDAFGYSRDWATA